MKFQKSIKELYNKKVPKKTRQKIGKVWRSEEGNYARKNVVHRINRGMAKHKDAAIATMAAAGGTAGGYVGGPEGAAIGAFLAEKYGRKAYDAGQKLGQGQERRIDRRIQRGFDNSKTVTVAQQPSNPTAKRRQLRITPRTTSSSLGSSRFR